MTTERTYSAEELTALVAERERAADERNVAARSGRYIAARSEGELANALLELEWRVLSSDDVGVVLELQEQVRAVSGYLRSTRRSLALQKQSEVVKLRAERRAGELLLRLDRGRWVGVTEDGDDETPVEVGSPYGRTLRETGLSERRAERLQEVARIPAEQYEAFVPSLDEMRALSTELAEDLDGRVTELVERRDFSRAALLRSAREAEGSDSGGAHRWDEWLTPPSVLRRGRELLGAITLDPCADERRSVGALQSFGAEDDGLGHAWDAARLLVNPPFSQVGAFVEKWARERAAGHAGASLLVLPAPVEDHLWGAPWWRLVADLPACLLGERFRGERHVYPLTVVSYAGEETDRFADLFASAGVMARFG